MSPLHHLRQVGDRQFSPFRLLLAELQFSRLIQDRRFHFCLIAAMALLVLFSKLHIGDLGGYDDAVYAHEGKQMLTTGQWWSVYLNGQLDFDKPPMFVWLEAISMAVWGVTDFAAKFPAALLGFGSILLVYFLACELSPSYRLPVWAMLILLCTQVFVRFSMRAMTDVPFTFFFLLTIFAYLKGLKQSRYFLLFGLAASFAILTRSFLGFIPVGIVGLHLVAMGQWRRLLSKSFIVGLVIAVGLPMVWFVSQYLIHGSEFLVRHFSWAVENLPLANGKDSVQFRSGLFQYPLMLVESYWPWLPLMLVGVWLQTKRLLAERDSSAALLLIWVFCVIFPFSLIHYKWLRYILPVFPAFAILSAFPICHWIEQRQKNIFPSMQLKILYGLLAVTMVVMASIPKYHERPEELRKLAPVAEAATLPDQRILLYTERAPRDAHLFQLIWYANRRCELLTESKDALSILKLDPKTAVIMDKAVFRSSIEHDQPDVEVLAETDGFVCWTVNRLTETARQPGTKDRNPLLPELSGSN